MSNPWHFVSVTPDGPLIATSVTAEETAALGVLALGRDCLEVGSAWGYSAIMMTLHGARTVASIDFHQPCDSNNEAENSFEVMRQNLDWFKADVTMIRQPSQEALPALAARGARFGLAFIDGDHAYEGVRHDLEWARKLVSSGFIACHDYGEDGIGSVTRAVDETFPDGPDWLAGTLHVVKVR